MKIKFRAKCCDARYGQEQYFNKVIYSESIKNVAGETYLLIHGEWIEVDPETIQPFTGIEDRNHKEIYIGDIVEVARRCYTTGKTISFREEVIWSERDNAIRLRRESESLSYYYYLEIVDNQPKEEVINE